MKKYKILKTLGDGTFGSVVKAINVKTRADDFASLISIFPFIN